MATGIKARLEKLESIFSPAGPKVFLWDDGHSDMKSVIALTRAKAGNEHAEIVFVGWQRAGETAQMETAQ